MGGQKEKYKRTNPRGSKSKKHKFQTENRQNERNSQKYNSVKFSTSERKT